MAVQPVPDHASQAHQMGLSALGAAAGAVGGLAGKLGSIPVGQPHPDVMAALEGLHSKLDGLGGGATGGLPDGVPQDPAAVAAQMAQALGPAGAVQFQVQVLEHLVNLLGAPTGAPEPSPPGPGAVNPVVGGDQMGF